NQRILNNRIIGVYIRNYRSKLGIHPAASAFTLALLWASLILSAIFATENVYIRILLGVVGLGVSYHVLQKTRKIKQVSKLLVSLLLVFFCLSMNAQSKRYEIKCFFSEGFCAVMMDAKWGFIDKTGVEVIPLQYDAVMDFNGGLAAVMQNGKWGFINPTNNVIVPFQFEEVRPFSKSGLAAVMKNGKWGFINRYNSMIIKSEYDEVSDFSFGLVRARKGKKWGFLSTTGEVAIPFEYDWVGNANFQTIVVEKNGREYFINHTGRTVKELPAGNETAGSKGTIFLFKRKKYKFKGN
ncbi:MAG: WG repeat-containing protein, partial [Bacteroidetes bacterium]|nr:WG repeat-containing protein [Bacteroidota bacterium]